MGPKAHMFIFHPFWSTYTVFSNSIAFKFLLNKPFYNSILK